jgi:hypothetical protein
LFSGGVARPQVFSNLGHSGGAFNNLALLGCFPADLGILLEFGQSSLIDVILLVEQIDEVEWQHIDVSLLAQACRLTGKLTAPLTDRLWTTLGRFRRSSGCGGGERR